MHHFWKKVWMFQIKSLNLFMLNCTMSRRRQWHPAPVLLPGESHGRGSLVGCCLWGRTESDTTEVTSQQQQQQQHQVCCQRIRGSSANFFIVVGPPSDGWAYGILCCVEPSVFEVVLNGFLLEWVQHKEGVLGSSGAEAFLLKGPCPPQCACSSVGFVTPGRLCR